MKPFAQEIQNRLRPGSGVIAAGVARNPDWSSFMSASTEVSGGQSVQPAAGNPELISRLNSFQPVLRKTFEHISNKGRRVTSNELLVIFRT